MKKLTVHIMLLTAAVVLILMLPLMFQSMGARTPGIEVAYAGDGINLSDIIHGVNGDGTIDPGATISVSMADLESKRSGIKAHYEAGEVSIGWYMGEFGNSRKIGTYADGVFSAKVTLKDATQKVWLETSFVNGSGFDDSYYNTNSEQYTVYSGKISINKGPAFGNAYATTVNPIVKTLEFEINDPYLNYTCTASGKTYTSYDDIYVKLVRGTDLQVVDDQKLTGPTITFKNVTLPVGKEDQFKAIMYFYYGPEEIAITFPFKMGADALSKNHTYATAISKNMAIVRWTGISGASGYYIYQGGKKVKTVKAATRKVTIKRRKAGKSKFKVIPFIKAGGKTVKAKSSVMKAKSNGFSTNVSTNYKNYSYGRGQVVLKRVTASGKKYTITCYAMNNRIFALKKYKKIVVKIYADGKCVASKTVKNLKVNMKPNSAKKLTFTVKKGKYGDLRHGSVSYSLSYTPYWGPGLPVW